MTGKVTLGKQISNKSWQLRPRKNNGINFLSEKCNEIKMDGNNKQTVILLLADYLRKQSSWLAKRRKIFLSFFGNVKL